MAKRELIDKAQIEWYGCDFESPKCANIKCKDCDLARCWKPDVDRLSVFNEQEIVKPYLEKLKADIEAAYDEVDGYDPDSLGTFASRVDDLIDNLLSEQEAKE